MTRIGTTEVTQTEIIAQPGDQQVDDSSLAEGTTEVTQQGRPGEASVVYAVTTTNGVETGRTEVSRTVTVEALPTITAVGTKVATPAPVEPPRRRRPPATPRTTTPTTAQPPAPTTTTAAVRWRWNMSEIWCISTISNSVSNWDGLAGCESGHNPRAINPSGRYTGLFQFDDSTWRGVGGSGRAYDASAGGAADAGEAAVPIARSVPVGLCIRGVKSLFQQVRGLWSVS